MKRGKAEKHKLKRNSKRKTMHIKLVNIISLIEMKLKINVDMLML